MEHDKINRFKTKGRLEHSFERKNPKTMSWSFLPCKLKCNMFNFFIENSYQELITQGYPRQWKPFTQTKV